MKQDGIGRETNRKRLLIHKTNRVAGGGGHGEDGWVMDIGEGM